MNRAVLMIVTAAVAFTTLGSTSSYSSNGQLQQQSLRSLNSQLHISFNRDMETIEYGSGLIDSRILINDYQGELTVSSETIDTDRLGCQTITFTVSSQPDVYGQRGQKEYTRTVKIVDTQAPVISLKKNTVTVRYGATFDPYENIESVIDNVNGSLTGMALIKRGAYTVEGEIDTWKTGTYTFTVTAMDKSGNTSTATYQAEVVIPNTRVKWNGKKLTRKLGTIIGPSGKETYYNLNMDGVVRIMRRMGNTDEYWVRSDGVKMLGDYVMVAANLTVHPRGSYVLTSLGMGIVCDTGAFAHRNPYQLDIAVDW